MRIEIRVYKTFDTDLIALIDSGYPVADMMRSAIISYANGAPLFYYIDEYNHFDLNGKRNAHLAVIIPKEETKALYLLSHIKHRYRNTFCKTLLRNSLILQNMTCFFADPALAQLQNDRYRYINLSAFQNAIALSDVRKSADIDNKRVIISPTFAVNVALPQKQPFGAFTALQQPVQQQPLTQALQEAEQPAQYPLVQPVSQEAKKNDFPSEQTEKPKKQKQPTKPAPVAAPAAEPDKKEKGEPMNLMDAFDNL